MLSALLSLSEPLSCSSLSGYASDLSAQDAKAAVAERHRSGEGRGAAVYKRRKKGLCGLDMERTMNKIMAAEEEEEEEGRGGARAAEPRGPWLARVGAPAVRDESLRVLGGELFPTFGSRRLVRAGAGWCGRILRTALGRSCPSGPS